MVPDANYRPDRCDRPDRSDRPDQERPGPATPEGVARTGTYEADEGVVFYDSEQPLAWLRADRTCRLVDHR